jgi:hypothetical protein
MAMAPLDHPHSDNLAGKPSPTTDARCTAT